MRKLLIVAALFLAGCGSTPQQKVFNAHSTYDAALSVAATYRELPECPKGAPVCHDKVVLQTVRTADKVAFEALKSGQTVVRDEKQQTRWETASTWAQEAVNAFNRVVSTLNKGAK